MKAMEIKMKDEKRYLEEMTKKRNTLRRKIGVRLKVNSKPYRQVIKELRRAADDTREEYRSTYEEKLRHLQDKYRGEKDEDKVPEIIKEFDDLNIFSSDKYEEIQVGEEEILCISKDICLSDDERAVLRLHTEFLNIQTLQEGDVKFEQELAYAKVRMERRNDLEEEEKKR